VPYRSRSACATDAIDARRRRLLGLLPAGWLLAACRPPPSPDWGVGLPFPDFALPDLGGQLLRRADLAGAPRLLNFWATWCPPCRAEMAGLRVLHRRLQAQGGGVVAISVDDDSNLVREFVLSLGIDYPVLLDRQRTLADGRLRLASYPTSVLLRRDGRVAEVVIGERAWDAAAEIDAVLAALA